MQQYFNQNLFSNKISYYLKYKIIKDMTITKSSEMVDYLKTISNKTTFDDLKQGLNGIFDSLGNTLIVNFHQKKSTHL